jgi:hypothetical protein
VNVLLSGIGVVPAPNISVSPTSLNFVQVIVGGSSTKTVTVSNAGDGNLAIVTIALSGTNADHFSIPTANDHCSNQTVLPSSSCTFDVKFSPTLTGCKSATLSIPSNDPDIPTVNVPLNGNGFFPEEITITLPIGGDILPSGGIHGICWKAPNNVVKFDLYYSINNGTSWNFIKTVKGLHCTHWEEVPVVTANKKQCRVQVIGYDSNGTLVGEDISDKPFTIEVLRVTSPNGAETLTSDSTWTVRWVSHETIRPVVKTVLKYTTSGGATWTKIKSFTGNPESYNWIVPNVSSTKCKVKVILNDASGIIVGSDVSDKVFTIQP